MTAQQVEGLDCVLPAHAVARQSGISLEVAERSHGVWTENPIDLAAVEAEPCQRSLEIYHVVPAEVRRRQLKESFTEVPSGLDERRPCRRVALAGLDEVSGTLEVDQGCGRRLAESTEFDIGHRQAERGQSTLEVADRLSRGPGGQWELLRNSSNSWSRALLLLAPTIRRRTSPPENSSIVGMLITW